MVWAPAPGAALMAAAGLRANTDAFSLVLSLVPREDFCSFKAECGFCPFEEDCRYLTARSLEVSRVHVGFKSSGPLLDDEDDDVLFCWLTFGFLSQQYQEEEEEEEEDGEIDGLQFFIAIVAF